MVDAPRAGLDRAISNIVDNACKFDQTGDTVEVVIDRDEGGTTLTVLDRGPGIPDGDLEKVFDRFHRAEGARTMPGSGLGLAIVREVVERVGGTAVAVNRDGGGAAIGFSLPDDRGANPLPPPTLPSPAGPPEGAPGLTR
jgi:two-component system sensor histidine kinase MprB